MNRRHFLAASGSIGMAIGGSRKELPNVVIILADDQAYGDLGCYGSPDIRTPRIDALAGEGMRMTHFYAAPVCGPSRAALMTGCYPPRVGMNTNLGPRSTLALDPNETTLASLVKPLGYATMCIGKWHLGSRPPYLPQRYGFDHFFGTPYSHDMWPFHPMMPPRAKEGPRMTAARERAAYTGYAGKGKYLNAENQFPDLPLYRDNEIVELNPDISKLTTTYTDLALKFIRTNQHRPFLLYFAHNKPHVPHFPGERFRGKSKRGLYGDVIEEIDWSTGELLDTLKETGLERNTLVIYTSDNGPWLEYGVDGGSAGPLRDGKGTTWEGGLREPGIFRWTGTIPAGQISSEVGATMDILPTIAEISGGRLPSHTIDGRSLMPLLHGTPRAQSPHSEFYYFHTNAFGQPPDLQGVRKGLWKLRVTLEEGRLAPAGLYQIGEDIDEKFDRSALESHRVPDMLSTAQRFYDQLRRETRPLVNTTA